MARNRGRRADLAGVAHERSVELQLTARLNRFAMRGWPRRHCESAAARAMPRRGAPVQPGGLPQDRASGQPIGHCRTTMPSLKSLS
jgi:hypothetical protein